MIDAMKSLQIAGTSVVSAARTSGRASSSRRSCSGSWPMSPQVGHSMNGLTVADHDSRMPTGRPDTWARMLSPSAWACSSSRRSSRHRSGA
ncbi:MAG: hypothetical protein EBY44_08575 [Actinobacteria bacterium]|nr:hypothetical protein [Actinomycetota bacterium]